MLKKLINELSDEWKNILRYEIEKKYFKDLEDKLIYYYDKKNIFPPKNDIFNAFKLTNFCDIKVVILGQDPYHNDNQAMGLSFSVNDNIKFPPSLKNIFLELKNEYNIKIPNSGNLTNWALQGVFLLNSTLTVEKNLPNSHKDLGWQTFTDFIIEEISKKNQPVVFMLWGAFAQNKRNIILKNDINKIHLILETSHPSPFSAHKGFLGCNHFKIANNFLNTNYNFEINWEI